MNNNVIRIGDGDPAGGEEILLINSVDGWLLVIPWGYDYGCGITKVIKLTEEEKDEVVEMHKSKGVDTNKILDKFILKPDEAQ